MPYFSARGFVGSVLFHTPPGKWVTPEQNIPPVTARYKGEERQRWRGCLTQPTRWPLKMTVKWLTYLTNAIMWKVCFSSIFPHTPIAKLWTGCMFTHLTRSEKKHQTDCWGLVGPGFFWLPFVALTWKALWKCSNRCINIAQTHIQRNIQTELINTLTHNWMYEKVAYVHTSSPSTHTYSPTSHTWTYHVHWLACGGHA